MTTRDRPPAAPEGRQQALHWWRAGFAAARSSAAAAAPDRFAAYKTAAGMCPCPDGGWLAFVDEVAAYRRSVEEFRAARAAGAARRRALIEEGLGELIALIAGEIAADEAREASEQNARRRRRRRRYGAAAGKRHQERAA